MTTLILPVLYTDADGYARFRDDTLPLAEGTPAARLSALMTAEGCRFRFSPVGFSSDFHCTTAPQWLVVLQGRMEIGLRDGTARVFRPGECFYSSDTLPSGAVFDVQVHGHRSRQIGEEPLVTLFVPTRPDTAQGWR
ncbi:MAG: hypothetical protein LBE78_08520 [Burkholderiaceae bacterium]|jgi:hypothetical protein|nr:hypothetical protein [Burkholderiaceae bacterium]